VPLAKIQSEILRLLAAHRDPESYVAGSTPLNVDAPRCSGDIDVFHDREERVARAAEADGALLLAALRQFAFRRFARQSWPSPSCTLRIAVIGGERRVPSSSFSLPLLLLGAASQSTCATQINHENEKVIVAAVAYGIGTVSLGRHVGGFRRRGDVALQRSAARPTQEAL
jgi:hypothetical protein